MSTDKSARSSSLVQLCVGSFAFYTIILALAVNITASLKIQP